MHCAGASKNFEGNGAVGGLVIGRVYSWLGKGYMWGVGDGEVKCL